MGGEQQGHPKPLVEPGPHVTGIGIVGMNPVGQARSRLQRGDQAAHQFIEVGPELLLRQVSVGPEGDAADRQPGTQPLLGLGVIGAHAWVVDEAGHHLHLLHLLPLGQSPNQIEHIDRLATGIGIAAQFEIMTPQKTVQMEMEHHQPHGRHNPWFDLRDSGIGGWRWRQRSNGGGSVARLRPVCLSR